MRAELEKLRGAKFIGVAELASEAAKILIGSGLAQERGTVSELPDERTIRYYMAEGLVPAADEKQGTASVFGYRHLLQLLVVKKLQSEHLPIRKIRDLVGGRSERELERLLGTQSATAAKNEALSYLEKLLMQAPPPAPPARARSLNQSTPDLSARAIVPPSPGSQLVDDGHTGTWSRVLIEPGLELHVNDRYQPPTDSKGVRRLGRLLLRVIESYGQRPGKRGS